MAEVTVTNGTAEIWEGDVRLCSILIGAYGRASDVTVKETEIWVANGGMTNVYTLQGQLMRTQ